LNGTRVAVLDQIRAWIEEPSKQGKARMFLLTGQAGLGKSAIVHSISHEYEKIKCLGAAFCFSKDRGATNFFRTIARNLADLDPTYAACLCETMTVDMESTTSMSRQLNDLFLLPFKTAQCTRGPILIVIDALDECNDKDRTELIHLLENGIYFLPANICILVTSRPNEAQPLVNHDWVKTYDLSTESATYGDVLLFVQHKLQGFMQSEHELVASSAESVFQYASVVCSEICSAYFLGNTYESPREIFARLVTRKGASTGLDGLYTLILTNAYKKFENNPEALIDFRRVMGRILVAQQRLTKAALMDFDCYKDDGITVALEDNYDSVSKTLNPLGALLSGTQHSRGIVYPLHSSFRDFLLDSSRSGEFCIESELDHHLSMAKSSLRLMHHKLCFNIVSLENSYIPNSRIPDLEERVQSAISRSLSYACVHWATHLCLSTCDTANFDDFNLIIELFNTKFLFWLEVLGLEQQIASTEKSCENLEKWLTVSNSLILNIKKLLKFSVQTEHVLKAHIPAMLHFIRDNRVIIENATPHLYISALLLTADIMNIEDINPAVCPQFVTSSGALSRVDRNNSMMLRQLTDHQGRIKQTVLCLCGHQEALQFLLLL
jgi:hypothetical protein